MSELEPSEGFRKMSGRFLAIVDAKKPPHHCGSELHRIYLLNLGFNAFRQVYDMKLDPEEERFIARFTQRLIAQVMGRDLHSEEEILEALEGEA